VATTDHSLREKGRVAFGLFEADFESGELWKSGLKVRLQERAFSVLAALILHAGQVVSREELQLAVWGPDVVVDFERSLASAVNKVRDALGDSAENPLFVETLPKRGYRFLAPVRWLAKDAHEATPAAHSERSTPAPESLFLPSSLSAKSTKYESYRFLRKLPALALVAGILFAVVYLALQLLTAQQRPLRIEQLTMNQPVIRNSPGPPEFGDRLVMGLDGDRMLMTIAYKGIRQPVAVDLVTGEVHSLGLPTELGNVDLLDTSADGRLMLLRSAAAADAEQSLWIAPTAGGSAMRVGGFLAHDATWMPDGNQILLASGSALYVVRPGENERHMLLNLPGPAYAMRWSPDGKLLRFTIMDTDHHQASLWQWHAGAAQATALPAANRAGEFACCGNWMADGSYVFEAGNLEQRDIWRVRSRFGRPILDQLTNGPLAFSAPTVDPRSQRIYFEGSDGASGLYSFSRQSRSFVAEHGFQDSAHRIDYTLDGKWVAWTTGRTRQLWRALAADGSAKLQLTPKGFECFASQWAPDGNHLALMARAPGKSWQIYLLDANGGAPEQLTHEPWDVSGPAWSHDGKSIFYSYIPDTAMKQSPARGIYRYDLQSHRSSFVAGSAGFSLPVIAPDGGSLAAISVADRELVIFDLNRQQWRHTGIRGVIYVVWNAESKGVYLQLSGKAGMPIVAYTPATGKITAVASADDFPGHQVTHYYLRGMDPAGNLLVTTRIGTGNLYSMELGR